MVTRPILIFAPPAAGAEEPLGLRDAVVLVPLGDFPSDKANEIAGREASDYGLPIRVAASMRSMEGRRLESPLNRASAKAARTSAPRAISVSTTPVVLGAAIKGPPPSAPSI